MATPTPSRILKVTRSSCTSVRGQSTSSRKRLGTPSALRLRGAASRIRFSNPPLNPRTHPGRGGVQEEADPEQVGLFFWQGVEKSFFTHPTHRLLRNRSPETRLHRAAFSDRSEAQPPLFLRSYKLDVAIIGNRPFFRIIRVAHDSHAIDQRRILAEGFLVVVIDIA